MEDNSKMILVFVAVVFIIGGLLYIYNPSPISFENQNSQEATITCPTDLKTCSDGSQVGRVPPSCEFEECKNIPTDAVFEDGSMVATSTATSTKETDQTKINDGIMCTMDAKECPDGSFVGRVPPSCEFKPCPTASQ